MSKVHFRTNALLKSIIGKDLITDDNIAVLELVKNSFDAGSISVDIIFSNILKNDDSDLQNGPTINSSQLIIRDEGIGMSEYDISEKWLNIAYSEKKEKKEEFGRMLAGNKGVGRFSCDRIGRFLTIYSRKKGEDYNKLFIDWKVFEEEGQIDFNIQDVEFEIINLSENEFIASTGYTKFDSGTILEIACLREYWHSNKILSLKRQLERLINPNQAFKKSVFGVQIIAKDFLQYDKDQEDYNKINGIVKNKIFEKLDFKTSSIQAKIDPKGEFITTTLKDRGNEIFLLKERNTFSQLSNIDISIYYLNTYSKAYFTKQTGIKSVDFGSIFLFINGFRIPPYGDFGDDWLGMERRKGQGYSRYLGTREIVGRIEINDESEKFKIISNRSGVVNNVAYDQLTRSSTPFGFYYKTFRRIERFVVEGINWDSVPEAYVENKVFDKKWDETQEKYNEDSLTRNKRVLSVISKIIDSKKDEIVDLKVNEDFVNSIISEQIEIAKKELESIIHKISDKAKELSPKEISSVLDKLSQNSSELKSFSSIVSSYSDQTKKEVDDLNTLQNSYSQSFEKLKIEKELLEKKLKEEEEKKRLLTEENNRLEAEAEAERKRNTFLLATAKHASPDALGLIHHIKNETPKINSQIQTLIDQFIAREYKVPDVIKRLHRIKLLSDKVLKISNLITRSNFNEKAETQPIDLVKYFEQYIGLFKEINGDDSLIDIVLRTNDTQLRTRVSIINISIIIDNLISNSIKANAKKILINFNNPDDSSLVINISDDGDGVPEKYLRSIDDIFKIGETSRSGGSGIGLYTVKDLLSNMKGRIVFKGNNIQLKGATFQIIFSKQKF